MKVEEKILLKGNIAIAKAAINAGCKCYFGYPITPQSEIGEYLSKAMIEENRIFIPCESELAAINMVIGAGSTGTKAMTSSSSCGIALMQEAISAMCCQQIPGVIISVMRGGPGLGNIAPSQGDYNQACYGGGNGDYKVIVLSPSTIQESIDLTYLSFHLAFKYRCPVILLADGVLGQMMEPCSINEYPYGDYDYDIEKWALNGAKNREPRNLVSLHMDLGELEKLNYELNKKFLEIEKNETRYENFLTDDANIIITAFGTVARVAKTAVKQAREMGIKVGLFRPITLSPFPSNELYNSLNPSTKVVLDVEMNLGQMLKDVKSSVFGKCNVKFMGKPGGGIINNDEILEKIIDLNNNIES